jgi:hypothetical protein
MPCNNTSRLVSAQIEVDIKEKVEEVLEDTNTTVVAET